MGEDSLNLIDHNGSPLVSDNALDNVVACVWHIYSPILDLYAYAEWEQCDLHL